MSTVEREGYEGAKGKDSKRTAGRIEKRLGKQ